MTAQRQVASMLYDSGAGTFSVNVTGFTTTVTCNFRWVKIGPVVHLALINTPTGTKSGAGTLITATAIPKIIRPKVLSQQPMNVLRAGTDETGAWDIATTGIIQFQRQNYANWAGGSSITFKPGTTCYLAIR